LSKDKRIFLVDDSVVNLNIGRRVLQEFYSVVPVTSGARLLAMLKKAKADLILLDIEMPEMDGYEVIKQLKENPDTAGIPVVFLTGHAGDEERERALSLGAEDCISKPFVKETLHARIESVLGRERA